MRHIYLHTSKIKNLDFFLNDPKFETTYEYCPLQRTVLLEKEYGQITCEENCYHIVVGSMPTKECPWCNGTTVIFKIGKSRTKGYTSYCIKCAVCGSRGPILRVDESIHLKDKDKDLDEYMELLWKRYKVRKNWDDGLVNPYEENFKNGKK